MSRIGARIYSPGPRSSQATSRISSRSATTVRAEETPKPFPAPRERIFRSLDLSWRLYLNTSHRVNHDVVLPPARDAGSHRRLSPRRARRSQRLLPRLQIMGSSNAKTPFRSHRILLGISIPTVEGDVSGSSKLSRSLHTESFDYHVPGRYFCGYECGRLDSHL